MLIYFLLLFPLAGAVISYFVKKPSASRWILLAAAFIQMLLFIILSACFYKPEAVSLFGGLQLAIDEEGGLIIMLTQFLFLLISTYIFFWLPKEIQSHPDGMKSNIFVSLLLLFLMTMILTALAQDFGTLWVAVEATTLASAPLVNYHRSKGSLEATWKYLLTCSIGIAIALFGTMLISASLDQADHILSFISLKNTLSAGNFSSLCFKAGFVLFVAGYGLKAGLAPFHTWLPDAHSQAPAPVSALLSGCLLNCALLAILRLVDATPEILRETCMRYLEFFGFFSLAAAAFFIIRQKDFKRMLAYSSVEHMGLLALFIAYGIPEGGILHVLTHSLCKMMLFLLAGNILLSYKTTIISQVRDLPVRLPESSRLWIYGMLLICGTPPSPLFFTELTLVMNAGIYAGAAILILLLAVFCGMSHRVLQMSSPGNSANAVSSADRENDKLAMIPGLTAILVTLIGICTAAVWLMERR